MKCKCGLEFGQKYLPKGTDNATAKMSPDKKKEFERKVAVGITMRKHPRTGEALCQFCINK